MNDGSAARGILEEIASKFLLAGNDFKEIYKIGDLAKEFGVSLRTLRFYEDRGLISPKRSGATRLYSPEDRIRLSVIILAKNIGFTLLDIKELMSIYDGRSGNLKRVRAKFSRQLEALNQQKRGIEQSIMQVNDALGLLGRA